MVWVVSEVTQYHDLWVYITGIFCINLGGIGNAIQYVINEGWRYDDDVGRRYEATETERPMPSSYPSALTFPTFATTGTTTNKSFAESELTSIPHCEGSK